MSLSTPTIKEIADNIIAQLEAALNQTIPLLQKAFLRVLAKVLAAVWVIQYKRSGFNSLQLFVATASAKLTDFNGITLIPLNEWGKLIGIGLPDAATQAELEINIAVTNQTGSLPSNTQLLGSDNNVTYVTIGAVSLNAPTVQANIRAVADQDGGNGSGAIGNLEIGSIVSFVNPLANVSRDALVASQVVTGVDAESTELYRAAIISRFQQQPQGGAYSDYRIWAEEVDGVVNAYIYTSTSPGEVNVYTESTLAIDPDGIPPQSLLDEVFASIELDENGLATRRPANAFVNSLPIDRLAFDVEVQGLTVDDPVTVQASIDTALTEYFFAKEPFIVGLSVLPTKEIIYEQEVSAIISQIASAVGGSFISAVVKLTGTPLVEPYALAEGEKAKLGSLTFL